MMISSKVVFTVLFMSGMLAHAETDTSACQGIPQSKRGGHDNKYHSDEVCDRTIYNQFKGSLNRHLNYKSLIKTGGNHLVPDQKTVYCPITAQDLKQPTQKTGLDTIWIVENTASFPVVITYVNDQGQEVSAMNPKVNPPTADKASVLQSGEWMAINTYEGHVFHARRILPGGLGMGQIVLQHRVGLIPVGNGAVELICPEEDIEPIEEETMEVPEEFQRTPPHIDRHCNTIDVGFRNKANCPLNGYFVVQPDSSTCVESFKFHLGVESRTPDFMWDWTSETKFEGSFIGHTFAFRLAADESVLVDTVTLKPTRVMDCPTLTVANAVNSHHAAVAIEVDIMTGNGMQQNGTDYEQSYEKYYYGNETSNAYQVHATHPAVAGMHSY